MCMCVSAYVHATIHMSQCVHALCVFAYTYMYVSAGLAIYVCAYMCACVRVSQCVCVACNLLHGSHVQHSCNLLCSPTTFPPMYTLHKYTHTHTHTLTYTPTSYMPSSHLLSLPSVLFSPISPLCPTQGSRLADHDVITTSSFGQLKVPQDYVYCMCACLFIFCYSLSICFCMCLN